MNTSILFVLLFGISGGEIIVILLLVLLLFGPKKIPEIARAVGKGMNEIKKVQRDINAEIHRYSQEIENPAKQITEDIEGFKKGLDSEIKDTLGDDNLSQEPGPKVEPAVGSEDETINPLVESDELPYPYNQATNDVAKDDQLTNDVAKDDQSTNDVAKDDANDNQNKDNNSSAK